MIVICEECGKKYRIDPHAIIGARARFKCRACGHTVNVQKPAVAAPEETQPADTAGPQRQPALAPERPDDAASDQTAAKLAMQDVRSGKMGLRAKMLLLFLVVPVLIIAAAGTAYVWQMKKFAAQMTQQTTRVVTRMGEDVIRRTARSVASQCRQYLLAHPDLAPKDFMSDENFRQIAVQHVGLTGYTALYEVGPMVTWAHPNPKIIGKPLTKLVAKPMGKFITQWIHIVKPLDNGENVENAGYYTWTDPDGALRPKFMVVTPVEGTKYGVAATIYMDEFTRPLDKVKREAQKRTAAIENVTYGIIAGTLLLVGLIVLIYSNRLTGRIKALTEHAERISVGELDAELDIRSEDEIGALGEAITRMQDSIRLSIERLRKRRR